MWDHDQTSMLANPPAGIRVEQHPNYVYFQIRLSGWSGWVIRISMLIFTLMTWAWALDFLTEIQGLNTLWGDLFATFHVGLAVSISYVALTYWRNTWHIFVSKDALEVYQAPLWMPGRKRFNTRDIEQVYVKHDHRTRHPKTYLRLKLHSGVDEKLLRTIYPLEHALYLERALEDYLAMSNRKVVGEYNPSKGFWDP
jgi:hypothetical protein